MQLCSYPKSVPHHITPACLAGHHCIISWRGHSPLLPNHLYVSLSPSANRSSGFYLTGVTRLLDQLFSLYRGTLDLDANIREIVELLIPRLGRSQRDDPPSQARRLTPHRFHLMDLREPLCSIEHADQRLLGDSSNHVKSNPTPAKRPPPGLGSLVRV